jgi:hypothetical protein
MKRKGWVTKREKEITDVICDLCKKSVRVSMGKTRGLNHEKGTLERLKENFTFDCFGTLSISGGYFSPHLSDGLNTEAHLCEKCWLVARKALEKIGVKFTDTDYLNGGRPWGEQ